MMLDQIKKTMEAGMDLALKTKEEVEDIAKDIIEKSKIPDVDAKKILDDFIKKYDEVKGKMESMIEKSVKEILNRLNLASKEDVNALKDEIEKIKQCCNK